MTKRKIEKWSEELFPGCCPETAKAYDHLHGRELIVVAAAIFDSALLEMIELRLVNNASEQDGLLGITRADTPVSSFTARIRLAYLLGLLRKVEANVLKALANLRNHMAHRASASLNDPVAFKFTEKLLMESRLAQINGADSKHVKEMIEKARIAPILTEIYIRLLLVDLQLNFDKRKKSITRLKECASRYCIND